MTTEQMHTTLKLRGCEIVDRALSFALVHPHGFEAGTRERELIAATREAAVREAWLWLHPEGHAREGIATIQRVVAADFGLAVAALINRDKHEPIATARRIAMALCRELTLSTFEAIGAAFERDHQTIIHAGSSVRDQCVTDKTFAARVGVLRVACSAALVADKEAA